MSIEYFLINVLKIVILILRQFLNSILAIVVSLIFSYNQTLGF